MKLRAILFHFLKNARHLPVSDSPFSWLLQCFCCLTGNGLPQQLLKSPALVGAVSLLTGRAQYYSPFLPGARLVVVSSFLESVRLWRGVFSCAGLVVPQPFCSHVLGKEDLVKAG